MNEKTKKALKIIFIVVILLLITLFIIITKKENQNVNIDCKKEECLTVNINNKENKEYLVIDNYKKLKKYSNKIEEVNKYNKEFFNNKKLLISKKDSCSHIKTEEQNETVILYYTMTDCVYLEDELEIIEVSKNIKNIKIVEKEL